MHSIMVRVPTLSPQTSNSSSLSQLICFTTYPLESVEYVVLTCANETSANFSDILFSLVFIVAIVLAENP